MPLPLIHNTVHNTSTQPHNHSTNKRKRSKRSSEMSSWLIIIAASSVLLFSLTMHRASKSNLFHGTHSPTHPSPTTKLHNRHHGYTRSRRPSTATKPGHTEAPLRGQESPWHPHCSLHCEYSPGPPPFLPSLRSSKLDSRRSTIIYNQDDVDEFLQKLGGVPVETAIGAFNELYG